MTKRMLIDALHLEETRVVIADDRQVYDFDFVSTAKKQLKGNIYLAKITRVEPSLQAAFVEYGGGKQGFLPFSEIHPDYYQIPVSDRKRLMEEAAQESVSEEASVESTDNSIQQTDGLDGSSPQAAAFPEMPPMQEADMERPAYLSTPIDPIPLLEVSENDITPTLPAETAPEVADYSTVEAQPPESTGDAPAAEGEPAVIGGEEKTTEGSMETLPNEEEEIRKRPKRTFTKRYKIQEVIRRGQIVLVQVIKEERGNKGCSLTTFLSLAGRYCVLMPNSPKDGGISRKIASPEDRKRLKQITAEFKCAEGMSVIIRTAGMDRTKAEIKRDYDYLVKVWNIVRERTLHSNAPALIHEESDIIKRSIRDQYTSDIDEVVVEGAAGYEAAQDFMKLLLPSHTPKIKLHDDSTPLFYAYGVEDQLLQMHDPVVKLKSGGYIVINPTEALISIDVNSGRATGERNIEETAAKTNIEAANEVARQLRLRDLAGLIVIDFIDMLDSRNRRAVERTLKDALKADRAKIQLGRISPFGLLEMSRQRLRPSISETNMVQCPHCAGRGFIRSNESMSIQIIRALEKEAATGTWSGFRVITPQAVGLHLLNTKRSNLRSIEERHRVTIQVLIDAELALSDFNLEKMRRSQNQAANEQRKNRYAGSSDPSLNEILTPEPAISGGMEPAETQDNSPEGSEQQDRGNRGNDRGGDRDRSRRRRGRGRRGGRNRHDGNFPEGQDPIRDLSQETQVDGNATFPTSPEADVNVETPLQQGDDTSRRPRRERGGRGRRRWRDDRGRDQSQPQQQAAQSVAVPVYEGSAAVAIDGQNLPAFATEDRIAKAVEKRPEPVAVAPVLESTPRDPNAPVKKGWWQKMIDLDS